MNKLTLTMLTVATLALVGCGGSSSSTPVDTTLKAETNMKQRFSYFKDGNFTKEENTLICHKGLHGDSYKIHISINDTYILFETHQHRKTDCSDKPFDYIYSSYIYELGDESRNKKSVNIALINDSFNYQDKHFAIESMVSKLVFGYTVLGEAYHTSVIGAGEIRTEKLKIAFAHASSDNNGSSIHSRAKDITNYSEDKFYFMEN